ncbi:PREDICTED: uncharacterized protein LOC106628771 [Pseudopodoces humilis]|uniref:uncharacterized protein LOC106628771 n=1 Tax=Pseudopodoces humilis TaxID=181119 RepID=UPI0006B7FAE8|nr:PREDICTED: uncharacterized protein LOC106628771 [Pseudopodoces humilis]
MSPPGGRRCPPALLALLLALAPSPASPGLSPRRNSPGSIPGSPECRDRAVPAGGSLCLELEEPPWEWTELQWRVKMDSGGRERILTAYRNGHVTYPNGSFHGRAEFQLGILSLCVSPAAGGDSGTFLAEFWNSSRIFRRCFRVAVLDPIQEPRLESRILARDPGWCLLSPYPIQEPRLESRILARDPGWCLLSLLCSSPGNVSYSWECPGEPPEPPEFPELSPKSPELSPESLESPSRLTRRVPEDAEPQICLCNVSNAAGWGAARAPLTCPGIPGNFGPWIAAAVAVGLILLLAGSGCCWKRSKNSREEPPGAPPEQPLTIYAEVGERKPRQDPAGSSEAAREGATVYAVVAPRTLEHPRHQEESGNFTVYSTVQFGRRPPSTKRKRLDRALVSTAYLEDNGIFRLSGFSKTPEFPSLWNSSPGNSGGRLME